MPFHPNAQTRLVDEDFDPTEILAQSFSRGTSWDNITDFATHPSFCGLTLYPRQRTLLKLIFLETENMTAYDLEVVEEWRRDFQRASLICGVQPDIWERVEYLKSRGYRRFPHIQFVLGRRASKGFLSAIVMAEMIGYLISLDNPQRFYGIQDSKDVFGNIGATSQTQAQRHQFADVRNVIEHCDWMRPYVAESKDHQLRLRTPHDLRTIATLKSDGLAIDHAIATLWVVALSASSVAGRGATSYFNAYDEFAFHVSGSSSTKDSENIYEDWQPSLGQFKKDALTLLPSSPFTKTGKYFELYQFGRVLMSSYKDSSGITEEAKQEIASIATLKGEDSIELVADPTMFIFQGPSWCLYLDHERAPELFGIKFTQVPENDLTDEAQQRQKVRNPEKFRVEREGQFADVMGQYLDPAKVDAIFDPVPWRDPPVLEPTPFGLMNREYRIHCDPSQVNANFAIAIGHVETSPLNEYGERWSHVIIDRLHVWQPKDFPVNPESGRREIDYTLVEREIDQILHTFPSTTVFSSDQWNSVGMLQRLKEKYSPGVRIREETATEKANFERCELFKSAVNLGWVHSMRDSLARDGGSLLELECKFLSERNGRVVKQNFGPVQTKDLFDAVSTVVVDLLRSSLARWHGDRLNAHAVGMTNVSNLRLGHDLQALKAGGAGIYTNGHRGTGNRAWAALESYQISRMRGQRSDPTYGLESRRSLKTATEWLRGRRIR